MAKYTTSRRASGLHAPVAALVAALLCALAASPAALAQKKKAKTAGPPTADGGLPRRGHVGLLFTEGAQGLTVADVARNSPAAAAGLRAGDVITAVDGEPVRDRSTLLGRARTLHAGDSLTLGLLRDGSAIDVKLAVDEAPREGDLDARAEYGAFPGSSGRLRSVWSVPAKLPAAAKASAKAPAKPAKSAKPAAKPAGGGHAAVLVIRGVGAPAADAAGANPFRDLAFHLAHAGLLVVRYDAEGVGDSEGGSNAAVDFDTEVADARAALAHVRADARVDPDRVILLGQGTGGGVAAAVAAADDKVAGLIVLGTIARPLMEYVVESRRAQLLLAGATPEEADAYIRKNIAVFSRLLEEADPAADVDGIVDADGNIFGKRPAFWREYDRTNFARIYSHLAMPVMNAVGEYDFVSCLGEHRAIADALKARGGSELPLVVLEGTDHDLRLFDSREAAYAGFESSAAETNERALTRITDWIRDNVKGAIQ